MALCVVLFAAFLISIANFLIRRNLDNNGSAKAHLLASFGFSLLASFWMNPQIVHTPFSVTMFCTGLATGSLSFMMMGLTAATLSKGPASLTFAFQTSGSVFPAIVLFLVFGSGFGFTITSTILLGLVLVLTGLLWAAKVPGRGLFEFNRSWLLFALATLTLHTLLLTLIQWRTLSFSQYPDHIAIPFRCLQAEDVWFSPGMFLAAFFWQTVHVLKSGTRPCKRDLILGSLGGSLVGMATYFLLLATTIASPIEKAVIFPTFSVGIIMICNLWGYFVYSERINWPAHSLCSLGILLASADI